MSMLCIYLRYCIQIVVESVSMGNRRRPLQASHKPISSSISFRMPSPLVPTPPTSLKLAAGNIDAAERDDLRVGTQVKPPEVSMSLAEYGLEGMGDGGV